MKLADQLRLLRKQLDADDPVVETSYPKAVERAGMIERLLTEKNKELTRANTPVKGPECGVMLTDSGWYEWRIEGLDCAYGYTTWREAHAAGSAVLRTAERDHYRGRIRGAVLYLDALAKALGTETTLGQKLKRVIKLLEEE